MEAIIYLLLIALAVYLIYLLVVYVVAPIAGVLSVAALVIGVGYAFIVSIVSFYKSLSAHKNPYTTYIDEDTESSTGVRHSYFFGPGYHQINVTVRDAFSEQKRRVDDLTEWMNGVKNKLSKWYLAMWVWLFYIIAYLCTFIFGFAWVAVFSTVLFTVIFSGMCIFYVFFTLLWFIDRCILAFKSVHCRCGNCKRISIVPAFVCPSCGMEHKKLTPGAYGIFNRKCVCGKKLPTTFINGRSMLKATCPFCATELAASDARQFGIQIVGGVSSGKTTLLAAFWHEYLTALNKVRSISCAAIPENAFSELEYLFQNGGSTSTTETNANMYSLIHKISGETPIQLTIYDIAGEAFSSHRNDIQQQQFMYCEGIILIIDPTARPMDVSETISSFIHDFSGMKGKRSTRIFDVPVAVIISKSDLFKREIGLPKIMATHSSNAQQYADADGVIGVDHTRCGICRDFLENHGFNNVLNVIDSEFANVQFYPVSAMGHPSAPGLKYEPWGVVEPIIWLLHQSGDLFQNILSALK